MEEAHTEDKGWDVDLDGSLNLSDKHSCELSVTSERLIDFLW